ncbi:MAG: amidohydrolase [Verrucomicrobia bacterium]|nr:amidohydrolase [Verrucomicrobiota bacterium]
MNQPNASTIALLPREKQCAEIAEALRPQLIAQRRDFHRHPELSNREERTARVVADKLRALGLDEVRTKVARHGVVALLRGGQPGPVVAVRADMDALPINETMDVPYKSLVPGVKHACGHDAHTAIGLGVAEVLSQMRGEIRGAVKFLFQPAEEGAPNGEAGGAPLMIKEGALENPRPLAIYGLHTTPEIAVGQVGWRAGGAQAAADRFTITIRGKSVHAAMPQKGVDAIVVAAECVAALQTVRSRRIDAFQPVILTVGTIHGGAKWNIVADEVKLEGTVRTLDEATRNRVEKVMRETLAGICAAYGAKYELDYQPMMEMVFNDLKLVEESLPALRRMVGDGNIVPAALRMGAEDFSYYQKVLPGFFYRLGSGNPAKGIVAEAHTPEFDIDEECLVVGVKTMAGLVLDFLERNAGGKASGQ